MRSPRSRFETACRIGAFGLLGWLLGGSIIPPAARRLERLTNADVATDLPALTRAAGNVAVHVSVAAVPEPSVVDWLGALVRSGRPVTWSGAPAPAAISVEPLVDPNGGARVAVAGPDGARVTLRDDASAIDSLAVTRLGASVTTPVAVGTIRGDAAGTRLAALVPREPRLRTVLVIGAAGWEGKFVASALEERGWPVTTRFVVAPNVDVRGATPLELDTARVSVVIALDSTVALLGPSLERYVRAGGGVVLAGTAASAVNATAIAPGRVAPRTRPPNGASDSVRLGSAGFYPVTSLRDDGVVIERRAGGVAVAARRVGAGRVVQVGYDDSWRWRMAGGPGSDDAHRAWWSRVAASVAYAPSPPPLASMADAAPVARLVDRLGAPRVAPHVPGRPVDTRILIILMMILLCSEWASRRLRGWR